MATKRYVIYCDEAYNAQPRLRYHHYYGGLLIDERFIAQLEGALRQAAESVGLTGEIKWGKVDARSAGAYGEFVKVFFDELAEGYFRIRVLFLDKYLKATNLIQKSKEENYFTLYYLFITRAFGWRVAPFGSDDHIVVRFFFDELPHKGAARARFKAFLSRMATTERFQHLRLEIPQDGISEIDSRDHRIAQMVDLLIGALGYRMNRFHKVIGPDGRRGKRTEAKDKVIAVVQARLNDFGIKNIGVTTGTYGRPLAMWHDPIRLWRLVPKEFTLDKEWRKKEAP